MITFNEEKMVKDIIKNHEKYFEFSLNDLKMVSKYFYKNRRFNEKEMVKKDLREFLDEKLYLYNESKYDDYIDNCLRHCEKYKLMESNPIPITNKEFNIICSIEDDEARRLMFTMLMYSKNCIINNIKIGFNDIYKDLFCFCSSKEIFKLAKVKYTLENSIRVKSILQSNGLVDYGFRDWCKILFYDYDDNDIYMEFMPYDSMVNYIIGFEKNKKSKICRTCGEWFSTSSKNNKTVLCSLCNKKNKQRQTNERVKKHRENTI